MSIGSEIKSDGVACYEEIISEIGICNEVKDVFAESCCLDGEHMGSQVEFVTVTFVSGRAPLSFFVKKRQSENKEFIQALKELKLFEKESLFYCKILPKIKNIMQRHRKNFPFLKCYYASPEMIVLENMKGTEYKMLNKYNKHDLQRARVVLKTMADYHAAAFCYLKEFGQQQLEAAYPVLNDTLGMDEKLAKMIDDAIDLCLLLFQDNREKIPDAEKLIKIAKYEKGKTFESLRSLYNSSECDSKFDTIVHADIWNNNIMFYDGNVHEMPEMLLIDMQTIRISSIATDIGYYLYLTLEGSNRRAHYIELLKFYFEHFSKAVCNMGPYKVEFTICELIEEYNSKSRIGYLMSYLMTTCLEVMDEVNIPGSSSDPFEDMAEKAKRWKENKPEAAFKATEKMAACVKEYYNNLGKW